MAEAMAAAAVFLVLASRARDVDDTTQRAISADIDASGFEGATTTFPGWSAHDEPVGAYSSQLKEALALPRSASALGECPRCRRESADSAYE